MEEQDKVYLWLVVIAFVALLVATAIGWADILELKSQELIDSSPAASTSK